MRHLRRHPLAAAVALAAFGLLASAAGAHADTLLSIGDSYAFGYSTSAGTPSNTGDNGYVKGFADALDVLNGAAARPTVLNLARPGETITAQSFASFSTQTTNPNGQPNYNQNYGPGFTITQSALLTTTLANPTIRADVKHVTVQIGGNDVLGPILSPQFQVADEATRQGALTLAFSQLQTNLTSLMQTLRTNLPTASIYLVGYGDPFAVLPDGAFPGVTPSTYPKTYTAQATQSARTLFSNIAGLPSVNAKFIDLYPAIAGNELVYTRIGGALDGGAPNYHLTDAGNALVANRLVAATVPEAGTLPLAAAGLGLGCATVAVARRRRQTAPVSAV
jgi:lysophospholipase L1-like esterase